LRAWKLSNEFPTGCLCGNALNNVPLLAASRCNVACRGQSRTRQSRPQTDSNHSSVGSANETCGSFISADVYDTGNAAPPAGIAGYEGCFNDIPDLNGFTYQSGLLSPLLCAQSCSTRGFKFSGTRYGRKHALRRMKKENSAESMAKQAIACVVTMLLRSWSPQIDAPLHARVRQQRSVILKPN